MKQTTSAFLWNKSHLEIKNKNVLVVYWWLELVIDGIKHCSVLDNNQIWKGNLDRLVQQN